MKNKVSHKKRYCFYHAVKIFVLFCLNFIVIAIILAGCADSRKFEGVIASVNGEKITLRSVESLLNSKITPMIMLQNSSLIATKQFYGDALAFLIIHALVRQELEAKGIPVKKDIIENEISVIKNDFLPDSMDKYFDEAFIDENDWKNLLRDHIELMVFMERILLPHIKISSKEIKEYYENNLDEFNIPDCIELLYLSSNNKELLENYCKNSNDASIDNSEITSQKQYIPINEINIKLNQKQKNSKNWRCLDIVHENDIWKTIVPIRKLKNYLPEIYEIYPLIENILLRKKLNIEFDKWLQHSIENSHIMIVPELKGAILSLDSQQDTYNDYKNRD